MSTDHVIVSTTTDSEASAHQIASQAVGAKLGACAQIVGPITSVFRWEGEVQSEQEWRVEIKTAADRVDSLTQEIKDAHSYDVPEVVVTPIIGGSAEYLDWVVAESRP